MTSCNPLTEGYAAHLTKISSPGGSVPAQGNARMVIPRFVTTFSDTTRIGKESVIFKKNHFSEPVLGCQASFNISLYHSATALNSPCGPTQKSHYHWDQDDDDDDDDEHTNFFIQLADTTQRRRQQRHLQPRSCHEICQRGTRFNKKS